MCGEEALALTAVVAALVLVSVGLCCCALVLLGDSSVLMGFHEQPRQRG